MPGAHAEKLTCWYILLCVDLCVHVVKAYAVKGFDVHGRHCFCDPGGAACMLALLIHLLCCIALRCGHSRAPNSPHSCCTTGNYAGRAASRAAAGDPAASPPASEQPRRLHTRKQRHSHATPRQHAAFPATGICLHGCQGGPAHRQYGHPCAQQYGYLPPDHRGHTPSVSHWHECTWLSDQCSVRRGRPCQLKPQLFPCTSHSHIVSNTAVFGTWFSPAYCFDVL